jgi:hypothetical protein
MTWTKTFPPKKIIILYILTLLLLLLLITPIPCHSRRVRRGRPPIPDLINPAIPVIATCHSWLSQARFLINVALARRSKRYVKKRRYDPQYIRELKPAIVVLFADVPELFIREVLNTEDLIVIRAAGKCPSTVHVAVVEAITMASILFPTSCLMTLHPNELSFGSWKEGDEPEVSPRIQYASYYSFVEFDCHSTPPLYLSDTPLIKNPDLTMVMVSNNTDMIANTSKLVNNNNNNKPITNPIDTQWNSNSFFLLLPPHSKCASTLDFHTISLFSFPHHPYWYYASHTWMELQHNKYNGSLTHLLQNTREEALPSLIRRCWFYDQDERAIMTDQTYRWNPLHCYRNHVRRTPIINNPTLSTTETSICLGVPVYGKPTSLVNITMVDFFNTLVNHTEGIDIIRLYLAWEDTDRYFSNLDNQESVVKQLISHQQQFSNHQSHWPKFEVMLRKFPYVEYDLSHLWNMVFLEAYEDGCEYFMHITDDVVFSNTKGAGMGWQQKFITLLRNQYNLGIIGSPFHVQTMPFVHRTHLEIFYGMFYSKIPHNIMVDTSIYELYYYLGLLAGPNHLQHWVNLSDNKTTRGYQQCEIDHYYDILGQSGAPQYSDLNYKIINEYATEKFGVTFRVTATLDVAYTRTKIRLKLYIPRYSAALVWYSNQSVVDRNLGN